MAAALVTFNDVYVNNSKENETEEKMAMNEKQW